MPETLPIIFFDGVCSLCNGFVDFLIRRMQRGKFQHFYFASLQGQTAVRLLPKAARDSLESIILLKGSNGEILKSSDAVLEILSCLPAPWCWANLLRFVPKLIRDSLYLFITKHRYPWFGKRQECRLPTPEEKVFFLP